MNYGYDAQGQVTSAGSQSYSYDANGNPSGNVASYNQVDQDASNAYVYDNVGNVTQQWKFAAPWRRCRFPTRRAFPSTSSWAPAPVCRPVGTAWPSTR